MFLKFSPSSLHQMDMENIIQANWNRFIWCGSFARIIHPPSQKYDKYGWQITKYDTSTVKHVPMVSAWCPHDISIVSPRSPPYKPMSAPLYTHYMPSVSHHVTFDSNYVRKYPWFNYINLTTWALQVLQVTKSSHGKWRNVRNGARCLFLWLPYVVN